MDARFLVGGAIVGFFFLVFWLSARRSDAARRAREREAADAAAEMAAAKAVEALVRARAIATVDSAMGAPPGDATQDPYRSMGQASGPDAELARLAAQGERRVLAQNALRHDQREWVRLARLIDAMQLLPPGPPCATIPSEAEFPGGGDQDNYAKAPDPSLLEAAARKAYAERAWLASLPFRVQRYFDVLAEAPEAIFRLDVTITLVDPNQTPSLDILRGVVHVHDVDAEVFLTQGGPIGILVGDEAVASPGSYPYTVRKIAPYVHGLVDRVLLPLHRSHPIASVSLTRS